MNDHIRLLMHPNHSSYMIEHHWIEYYPFHLGKCPQFQFIFRDFIIGISCVRGRNRFWVFALFPGSTILMDSLYRNLRFLVGVDDRNKQPQSDDSLNRYSDPAWWSKIFKFHSNKFENAAAGRLTTILTASSRRKMVMW